MNFNLTAEQRLTQQMIRDFVENEVKPLAAHTDHTHEFPWASIKKMGPLGLLGLNIPEEWDGAGADHLSAAILIEELGRGCGSTALTVAAHLGLACAPLAAFGSDALKERYLKPLARGEMLGALSLTEPGAGSDLKGGVRTTAVRAGDAWVINGSKMWMTNASVAGVMILLVRTGPASGSHALSHILVPADTPGVTVAPAERKMGLHGCKTHAVSFEDVRVPLENLVGEEGRGLHQTLTVLDGGRIGIGALSVGLAQAAYEESVKYSHERHTFGAPLASHQAIQFKIADMATQLHAARLMVYHAAWLRDQKQPINQAAAQAKLFATEMAEKVCFEAIQIHGGYGYSAEFPVERIYRDNRLMLIGEGTSEINRLVIARNVLGV
ncbi:MAG: acyl-CoA dehydrogenase family protein [Caldilineales bacterium]|nr:acyl-CoA dehydrogenase family protein [Caldilineales bacterium]